MSAQAAYLAGVFDGEGCVIVNFANARSRSLRCALEISNTHRGLILALQEEWGGRVYSIDKPQASRAGTRPWRVRFTGETADRVAAAMLPYAIVKREQLLIFQRARTLLYPHGGRARFTPEALEARHAITRELLAARTSGIDYWNVLC